MFELSMKVSRTANGRLQNGEAQSVGESMLRKEKEQKEGDVWLF